MQAGNAVDVLVDESGAGMRFDSFIAERFTDCSRSLATALIRNGTISIGGKAKKPGYRLKTGDRIYGEIPEPVPVSIEPEPLNIDILFEDADIIIVNKQAGLVVHPAPGHSAGTLVNGLLHHCPDIIGIGGEQRPGIVHRLDKDTSGVLVTAKHGRAHEKLAEQFASRKVKKSYMAIVQGLMKEESGFVCLPIGRHPTDRKKMSTKSRTGRPAETRWHVRERFSAATLVDIDLKTGRTHQIRVHLSAIGHPVAGDAVYGGKKPIVVAGRQMLHAFRLEITHPSNGKHMKFEAPVPGDMKELIDRLRNR